MTNSSAPQPSVRSGSRSGAVPIGSATGTIATGAIAFSDIVGFTELTADYGDDLALDLVEHHEALVNDLLGSDGRIVKQLGDGVLMFFDDARRAMAMLLALHRKAEAVLVADVPLWLRSGVHWGSPRVRGTDLIGHDVNLASRITALAAPGELLVTDSFVQAVGDAQPFVRVGPVFVKGVSEPVRLWRATAPISSASTLYAGA